MENGKRELEHLGNLLTGLSERLGAQPVGKSAATVPGSFSVQFADSRGTAAQSSRSPPPAAPGRRLHRQGPSHARPASPVLRSANSFARDAPLGGMLQRYKDAEAAWLKEKGRLTMAAEGEKKQRLKAEAELRRVQQQLAFRVGEVQHLKTALKGRDCQLQELQDRLREYELAEGGERTSQEAVLQAQGERDELRTAVQEVLQRLDEANKVIGEADANMAGLEAQVAAATAEKTQAQQAEAAALAEAQALRETVADLQWKCDLLQRLSDLTLEQNEEKAATLHTLLESESMLDAASLPADSLRGDGLPTDGPAGLC